MSKAKKGLLTAINAIKQEREEYLDKWKRALAELENYRKRCDKQQEEIKKFATEDILYQLLGILDNFDRALTHINASDTNDAIRQGIDMIHKELKNLLAQHGVKPIDVMGKEYDPEFHEALEIVNQKDSKEEKSSKHMVVEEVLPGYTLHNRLLRPAKVKISNSEKTKES